MDRTMLQQFVGRLRIPYSLRYAGEAQVTQRNRPDGRATSVELFSSPVLITQSPTFCRHWRSRADRYEAPEHVLLRNRFCRRSRDHLRRQSMTMRCLKRNQRNLPVYQKAGLLHTQRNGFAYRMLAELNLLVFNAAGLACHVPSPACVTDVSPFRHGGVVCGASLICQSHRRHCSGR